MQQCNFCILGLLSEVQIDVDFALSLCSLLSGALLVVDIIDGLVQTLLKFLEVFLEEENLMLFVVVLGQFCSAGNKFLALGNAEVHLIFLIHLYIYIIDALACLDSFRKQDIAFGLSLRFFV